MDKKKSKLNIIVSVVFRILTVFAVVFVRRVLIQTCGNEANGLNSLYLSIISLLAVAELGSGAAITFCMYKPIVEGDHDKVSALFQLFRRMYLIVGGIIFAGGIAVMPFLKFLANDYAQLDINLHSTFFVMLCSVVLSYFFGAKTALINAHKNNYITTAISSCGILLQYGLQIVVLITTHSFLGYLLCRVVAVLLQWLLTELYARKSYNAIIAQKSELDRDTRLEVTRNIKAMFIHKIGGLLVNTMDSVVISACIGVVILGAYSNYTTIMSSMTGIIEIGFSALTSIWGHMFVQKSKQTSKEYCEVFHLINCLIGMVFYLGYYAIVDNLVAILFSSNLQIERTVSMAITFNGFVQFMRRNTLVFRDATGTFYYDRWKPLVEGGINILLSVVLVKSVGLIGAITATIITNILICHIVEPYVLFRHAFDASPKKFYLKNYGMILLFGIALILLNCVMVHGDNRWNELLKNGFLSIGVSLPFCLLILLFNRNTVKCGLKLLLNFRMPTEECPNT